MRCVFNSPRPSQRTWPKRKAFPNEIASVSFLALTFPTSSSRTSDGTRNLFSPPLRIAVNTSRAQRGRRPQRGGVSRPLLRHPKAPQLPGQGRSLQPLPPEQARSWAPVQVPQWRCGPRPTSRLQPATRLVHTKPQTHSCGRGAVRANSPRTRAGRGRRGRVGGTGWDSAAQVRARRHPGRSLTR